MNNFPYVLAVEKLAGIEVPDRAKVIRVMLAELFRIISHLVFYGTFGQDLGADVAGVLHVHRPRAGLRHRRGHLRRPHAPELVPHRRRGAGPARGLGRRWSATFSTTCPPRLDEYDEVVMQNRIFKARTEGVGAFTLEEAIEWGATGPMLRACGLEWDFRKKRPYGGYDQFEFDIPTGTRGDCYDRARVHVEEMRQSLRIIEQCLENMPAGDRTSRDHPLATPPLKERTMHDIETLIDHFLSVSWGPVIPPGEAFVGDRGHQGQQQLLPGQRRRHDVLPHADPHAVVPAHPDAAADGARPDGRRT